MLRFLALVIALLAPSVALAQSNGPMQWQCGSTSTGAPIFCYVSSGNPIPITGTITSSIISGNFIPRSATLTTGGTSQQLMPANTSRKAYMIENPCTASSQGISTAENVFVNFSTAANGTDASSFELVPCGSINSSMVMSFEAINFVAATTGHKLIAKEQ